jgi:hypothetical protein
MLRTQIKRIRAGVYLPNFNLHPLPVSQIAQPLKHKAHNFRNKRNAQNQKGTKRAPSRTVPPGHKHLRQDFKNLKWRADGWDFHRKIIEGLLDKS